MRMWQIATAVAIIAGVSIGLGVASEPERSAGLIGEVVQVSVGSDGRVHILIDPWAEYSAGRTENMQLCFSSSRLTPLLDFHVGDVVHVRGVLVPDVGHQAFTIEQSQIRVLTHRKDEERPRRRKVRSR